VRGCPCTYRRSRRGEEDESTEVGSTLVGESAGGVDQGTDTVGLDGGTDEGASPGGGGTGSLLGLGELLGGVGALGLAVHVTEDGAEDGERGNVGEDGTEGDSRGLDRGEVWEREIDVSGETNGDNDVAIVVARSPRW
jgi:hypothetical protein